MKLYKREIKVYSVQPGFQGFQDYVQDLTDWLDEEEGIEKFEFYKNEMKGETFAPDILMEERFVLYEER